MRTLFVLIAALVLTGCGGLRSGRVEVFPIPPPSLTAPCAGPVTLPDRGMSDQEVEVMWGRDRSALRTCASRHGGLTDWVDTVVN